MAQRLPGIIVRVVNSAGIIAPPLFERYPVYIGEGDPYKLISDQKIVRSLGIVDDLFSLTTINDIVSVGDLPGMVQYVKTTDYVLSPGNKISWVGTNKPSVGDNFYVTFTETRPASAFLPTLYFDENLIYADHGEKTRTNAAINDVSNAGWLGLNAGAKGVIIAQLNVSSAVDPDAPTGAELEAAFLAMVTELNKITDWKLLLVPMSSGVLNTLSANNILFNHAVLCSQPDKKQERTVIGCLASGTTYQNAVIAAQSYAHERMVMPFPYEGKSLVVGDTTEYDTRFYNAALAGKLCSVPIGENISDEIIPNVLVVDTYEPDIQEYMVKRGVGPAKMRGEVVRNVYIGTTDVSDPRNEDLGVQDVKDYVKKYWREGLWNVYKNKKINANLLRQINTSSVAILEFLVSEVTISAWRNIAVSQDLAEPRKVNISAEVMPAYSLQWMDITFAFALSF